MSHDKEPSRLELALRLFTSVQRTGLLADLAIYKEVVGRCFDIADLFLEAAKPLCSWCWPPFPVHTCASCKAVLCSGVSCDTDTRHAAKLQQYYCDKCATYFCSMCLAKHEHRPAAG